MDHGMHHITANHIKDELVTNSPLHSPTVPERRMGPGLSLT
ncbi:hypothetical protein GCM10010301_73400 [Streptomyces plicatus]|nr:hypothetical protein GCM10010301_73400 [Streptomyces plicatus]